MNCEDENSVLDEFEKLGQELRENLNLIDLSTIENSTERENELESLRKMKNLFEDKAVELLTGSHSDEDVRKNVNAQLAQIGALWQKHEKPLRSTKESPIKLLPESPCNVREKDPMIINNSPLYLLNPVDSIDLGNPVYNFDEDNEKDQKYSQRGVLPRLDSHSLSDSSFNTKNFAESVTEMLAEFQNAYSYFNFKHFPIESLEEWDARLKVCFIKKI